MNAEHELWVARDANEAELELMEAAYELDERYSAGLLTRAEIMALPEQRRVSDLRCGIIDYVRSAYYRWTRTFAEVA